MIKPNHEIPTQKIEANSDLDLDSLGFQGSPEKGNWATDFQMIQDLEQIQKDTLKVPSVDLSLNPYESKNMRLMGSQLKLNKLP